MRFEHAQSPWNAGELLGWEGGRGKEEQKTKWEGNWSILEGRLLTGTPHCNVLLQIQLFNTPVHFLKSPVVSKELFLIIIQEIRNARGLFNTEKALLVITRKI